MGNEALVKPWELITQWWIKADCNNHKWSGGPPMALKQLLLRCKFLLNQVITDNFVSPNCLWNVPIIDLCYLTCLLQSMTKNVSEVAKASQLLKVAVKSRYWLSLWSLNDALRRSRTLLRRSTNVDRPLF